MKKTNFNYIGFLLVLIGGGLIAAGVMNGENTDVFEKAIRVCLECIGIG